MRVLNFGIFTYLIMNEEIRFIYFFFLGGGCTFWKNFPDNVYKLSYLILRSRRNYKLFGRFGLDNLFNRRFTTIVSGRLAVCLIFFAKIAMKYSIIIRIIEYMT